MRLIDAELFDLIIMKNRSDEFAEGVDWLSEQIDNAPTVEAYTKEEVEKAIDKVEEYICDKETDTIKAQGMCKALEIIEHALKGDEEVQD